MFFSRYASHPSQDFEGIERDNLCDPCCLCWHALDVKYLGSQSLVKVDWTRIATRFENLFYKTDAAGRKHPPTIGSLFRWLVDFLTVDFQARASFIAGLALGLRIG